MKAYTDILQSKNLAEILPLDSADMRYTPFGDTHPWVWNEEVKFLEKGSVPCWSLAALINILGSKTDHVRIGGSVGYWWCKPSFSDMAKYTGFADGDELVDVCVNMIIKLKERNLL